MHKSDFSQIFGVINRIREHLAFSRTGLMRPENNFSEGLFILTGLHSNPAFPAVFCALENESLHGLPSGHRPGIFFSA